MGGLPRGKGHGGLTRRRRVNLPNTGMGPSYQDNWAERSAQTFQGVWSTRAQEWGPPMQGSARRSQDGPVSGKPRTTVHLDKREDWTSS